MIYVESVYQSPLFRRLSRPPRYLGPRRVKGIRGSDGATEWDETESVWTDRASYQPKRGKVNAVRTVADDSPHAVALAAIDRERKALEGRLAELRREEQTVLAAAFADGRPVAVADLKGAQK